MGRCRSNVTANELLTILIGRTGSNLIESIPCLLAGFVPRRGDQPVLGYIHGSNQTDFSHFLVQQTPKIVAEKSF